MLVALLFWALTLLCCAFAAVYGGRAGHQAALACVLAVAATSLVTLDEDSWLGPQLPALGVDLALLVALVWIAMRSDRWFPIWFAGLQLMGVISHFASIVAPGFAPKVYFLLQSFWSIPMFVTLMIGVALDARAGIRDDPTRSCATE